MCRITESLKSYRVCSLFDMVLFIGSETADPGGRIVSGFSLRPLAYGDVGWIPAEGCVSCVVCFDH